MKHGVSGGKMQHFFCRTSSIPRVSKLGTTITLPYLLYLNPARNTVSTCMTSWGF